MSPIIHKRNANQLGRHLFRVEHCSLETSFCYRHKSLNEIEVMKFSHNCKSYFCPKCSKRKSSYITKRWKCVNPKQNFRFLTLTLSTEQYTPEQSVDKISYFFNLFVKYMRYRGFKFQYFKIIELTKNHVAHIHALVTAYLPKDIIQEVWKNITGSYITHIEFIYNKEHALKYVLKYMSKSIDYIQNKLFYLLRKRRISFSQSIFLEKLMKSGFILSHTSLWAINDELLEVNKYFKKKYERYNLLNFVFLNEKYLFQK